MIYFLTLIQILRNLYKIFKIYYSIFIYKWIETILFKFYKQRLHVVTSVFYIFSKAAFLIKLIIFNIIRLSLACLDEDIYSYINVFFLYVYFLLI